MRRMFFSVLLCSYVFIVDAQNTLAQYEYWFDQGSSTVGALDGTTSQEHNLSIDTKDLPTGLHYFHYRAQDTGGNWSPLTSWMFYVKELPKNGDIRATIGEYWIDNQYEERHHENVTDGNLTFVYDASKLSEGLHTFNYRIKDSEGMYSPMNTWMFFAKKLNKNGSLKVVNAEYWVDNKHNERVVQKVADNTISLNYNASKLLEGLHTFNYRVQDSEGSYSPINTWMFFRKMQKDPSIQNKAEVCEYWFDNNTDSKMNVPIVDNEVSFVADAAKLSDGAHTVSYRVRDVLGNYSLLQRWVFMKMKSTKGKRIAWYKTWWNNHYDKAETVNIEGDVTEYTFTKELVIPEYAKTDGYSRNSTARFNILFADDEGNISRLESAEITYPDNVPPISTIEVIEQTGEQVLLKWYANEDDILFYNIYVSEDNKPFVLWMPNTSATNATFKTKDGVSYRFMVTARDKAGNMEKYDETKCITNK